MQERLKLVTVLGAGLLCGTALAVIIPEGVHALYEEILEGRVQQCCISLRTFFSALLNVGRPCILCNKLYQIEVFVLCTYR